MNFTLAPTLFSTVIFLFRKHPPQPIFTRAVPPVQTQVYIARSTTTHVDPPAGSDLTANQPSPFNKKRKDLPLPLHLVTDISEKQQHDLFPETPGAPNPRRTTFVLPIHYWNTAEFVVGGRPYADDDQSTFCEVERDVPHGNTRLCHAKEHGVPAVEPKTLAKTLFFLGFGQHAILSFMILLFCKLIFFACLKSGFPAFWAAGFIIIWIPSRTTRDWEAGKTSMELKWECSVIRETELRRVINSPLVQSFELRSKSDGQGGA